MKTRLLLLLTTVMAFGLRATASIAIYTSDDSGSIASGDYSSNKRGPVTRNIDEVNFPDPIFRNEVSSKMDTNGDGILSEAEANAVTLIDVNHKGIGDLTGIAFFTNLKILYSYSNDFSAKGIDLSANTKLEELYLYGCKLKAIDVSMLPQLKKLVVGYNNLSALDVTHNPKLTHLDFYFNKDIASVEISHLTELTYLDVYGVPLGTLDVSHNTKLTYLSCSQAGLTALDVSMLPDLENLACISNQIASLDLSHNTKLTEIRCSSMKELKSINLTGLTQLKTFKASYCGLTDLVMPASPVLNYIEIYQNSIKGADMNAFVESLPTVSGGKLYAVSGLDDPTVINTVQVQKANAKGWTVYYNMSNPYAWTEYAGSSLGIAIDNTNFPDAKFRAEVAKVNYDKDQDGYLSEEEIAAVQLLAVNELGIESMKGLEHFTALKYLQCYGNKLTELDVTKNTQLDYIWCMENQLTTLDLSQNTLLKELGARDNLLSSLDLTKNINLERLRCYTNKLTELDVSKNTKLKTLDCSDNLLTTLDVTKNTELTDLECSWNKLTALDVTNNTKLHILYCNANQLTGLDLSHLSGDAYEPDVYISSNAISEKDMQTLVEGLPSVSSGGLWAFDSSDPNEKNVINKNQVELAKSKGWVVMDLGTDTPYVGTEPTGISAVAAEPAQTDAYYNMGGQRVQRPAKGIYIIGGQRKVIVK